MTRTFIPRYRRTWRLACSNTRRFKIKTFSKLIQACTRCYGETWADENIVSRLVMWSALFRQKSRASWQLTGLIVSGDLICVHTTELFLTTTSGSSLDYILKDGVFLSVWTAIGYVHVSETLPSHPLLPSLLEWMLFQARVTRFSFIWKDPLPHLNVQLGCGNPCEFFFTFHVVSFSEYLYDRSQTTCSIFSKKPSLPGLETHG